ncbi:type III pantothenate kinase [Piscinibacter gummiphilus]|uniref:Type III pantothenate kinase n=1 Tax=Piscinibacter gummiphilus TaxID=946333 RepID=A0ABZ0CVW8_9BURK|nr:type III pantothenate kinase [Piscinibacter gummiphilus]WOB09038.1 type III pantothenate kinase [Piscinibacter gummiphilus]
MTFLAIDVGNTRLKWGLYASPQPGAALMAHGAVFLETIDHLADHDWKKLPAPTSMLGCVVAGESIRRRVEEQLEIWDIDPRWVVSSAHAAGVTNGYEHPARLGPDRWVAMIGAWHYVCSRGAPRPVLVVMVGTAVTVDAVDESGHFLGGLILPGFGVMQNALEMGTAGLRVPTGEVVDFPTNTSDALMSGGVNAMAGAVERMYRKLRAKTGQEPVLLMSGGASPKLSPVTDLKIEVVERLVFDGLLALQSHRLAL